MRSICPIASIRDADARERAAAAAAAEDQAALLDSLTLCKFLRHALHDVHEESAALHRAVTGLATTADDLHQAGARIGEVKKRFNLAQGWTRCARYVTAAPIAVFTFEQRRRSEHRSGVAEASDRRLLRRTRLG